MFFERGIPYFCPIPDGMPENRVKVFTTMRVFCWMYLHENPMIFSRHCKRSYRKQRVFTQAMRPIMFHGYKIEILNNHTYAFRYEWKITAPKIRPRKIPAIIYDPTSSRSAEMALTHAKTAVAEMRCPMWLYNLNLEEFNTRMDQATQIHGGLLEIERMKHEIIEIVDGQSL